MILIYVAFELSEEHCKGMGVKYDWFPVMAKRPSRAIWLPHRLWCQCASTDEVQPSVLDLVLEGLDHLIIKNNNLISQRYSCKLTDLMVKNNHILISDLLFHSFARVGFGHDTICHSILT